MQVLSRCCGAGRKKDGQTPMPAERSGQDDTKNIATQPDASAGTHFHRELDAPKESEVNGTSQVSNGLPDTKKPEAEESLWAQAFKKLKPEVQARLRDKMGFNEKSGGARENIDAIKAAVQEKESDVEKKQWSFTVGGQKITPRNYTKSIVNGLTVGGDILINFSPPQAALPWAALKSIMGIAVADSEQLAALFQVTDKVVRVINRGVTYEGIYLGMSTSSTNATNRDTLKKDLIQVYQDALSLLATTHKDLEGSTLLRLGKTLFRPEAIQTGLAGIDAVESEISKDVDVLEKERSKQADDKASRMLKLLDDSLTKVDEGVERILQNVGENERRAMLNFISPVSFGDHHLDLRNKRTPETGEWLLRHENLVSWEQSGSAIFWLQGTAGTGKTYLTSKVVDHILNSLNDMSKDEGFAYFYCNRDEAKRHEEKHVLQSIVRQLSTTSRNPGSTQTKLLELYKESKEKGRSELDSKTCQEQIQTSLDMFPTTTIVIDALDEIDTDSRDDFIDKLKEFVSRSSNIVKVFISSRPDAANPGQLNALLGVSIEASDNNGDIRAYLDKALPEIAKKQKNSALSRLKAKIIDKLIERCNGMFQWAALQIGQLGECKFENSINNKLEHLPEGLEQAYKEIWDKIQQKEGGERLYVERAMLWVMAAWTPLTSEQLMAAVRVNTSGELAVQPEALDEDALLDLCKNLLTIDTRQKVWRFSHLSVREYLEERMGWKSHLAQLHAATACLTFFLKPDPQVVLRREQMAEASRQSTLSAMRKKIRAAQRSKTSKEEVEQMNRMYLAAEEMSPPELLDRKITLDEDGDENSNLDPEEIFDVRHPFHIYARHHIFKHIGIAQRGQNKDTPLAHLTKDFLGSPSISSAEYQRWYKQLSGNFVSIHPDHFSAAGFDHMGRDLNGLVKRSWRMPLAQRLEPGYIWEFRSILQPMEVAAFAMCHFDLSDILEDWWSPHTMDWNVTNYFGATPLAIAAQSGSTGACSYLITKAKVDVGLDSAANLAAEYGHVETLKCLLEIGDAKVDSGGPGTSVARAIHGPEASLAVVKLLKSHGAELFPEGFDSVLQATKYRKEEILDYLLEEGGTATTSTKSYNDNGYTALGLASLCGYTKVAAILLAAGADPNSREWLFGADPYSREWSSGEKVTPLHLAMYAESDHGLDSCTEMLRRSGAVSDPKLDARCIEDVRSKMTKYGTAEENMKIYQGDYGGIPPMSVGQDKHVMHSRPNSPVL